MTIRLQSKYKSCKRFKIDIWARIFLRKKRIKLRKVLKSNKRKLFKLKFKKLLKRKQSALKKSKKFKFKISKKKYKRNKNLKRYSSKTPFGKSLIAKQKVIKFYGAIKEYQFKKYLLDAKKNKKNILSNTLNKVENRLDIILFRSNLLNSIFQVRANILHGKIIRNNYIISKPGYIIKKQDIIQLIDIKNLLKNIKTHNLWGYPSKYAYINWKSLKLGIHSLPNSKLLNFPFKPKQRRILEFYKI